MKQNDVDEDSRIVLMRHYQKDDSTFINFQDNSTTIINNHHDLSLDHV